MTVLNVIQDAARLIGVPVPTSIIGNNDVTTNQLRQLFTTGGTVLSRRKGPAGGSWTVMQNLFQITTVADQEEYDLPADFDNFINDTAWNRDTYWRMRGPLTPQRWQEIRSGLILTPQIRPGWRLRKSRTAYKKTCFIDPIPGDIYNLVIEYNSNAWIADAAGTNPRANGKFEADDDVVLLEENLMVLDLVWRFKRQKGFAYAVDLAEFEREADRAIADDTGAKTLVLSRRRLPWPPGNVPETGYGGIV